MIRALVALALVALALVAPSSLARAQERASTGVGSPLAVARRLVRGHRMGEARAALAMAGVAGTDQDCGLALLLLDVGDRPAALRAVSAIGPDDATSCVLAVWARIAEAEGHRIRASVFYQRALARTPTPLAPADDLRRREEALPAWARALANGVLDDDPGAAPAVASLATLCELVEAREESRGYYDLGSVHCASLCHAEADDLAMAVLRVREARVARVEGLEVAIRDHDGWRLAGSYGEARVGGGEVGGLSVDGCTLRQLVPGGPPEAETSLHQWRGESDGAQCYVRRQVEVHRHVCARVDGEWRCHGWQIEARRGETSAEGRGCRPPPWSPPAAWTVALHFTPDAVVITPGEGALPREITDQLGVHALADVFAP